jgi:hypothetical protein
MVPVESKLWLITVNKSHGRGKPANKLFLVWDGAKDSAVRRVIEQTIFSDSETVSFSAVEIVPDRGVVVLPKAFVYNYKRGN